jgi:signal transduction histidine kinase
MITAQTPANAQPFDILVVDDTVENLRVIASMLSEADYHVRTATDGELALKSIAYRPPALVLLDIRMPGMDGFEVCRRIHGNPALADIPIILLSAQDDSSSRVAGFKAGAIDFIGKPFVVEEVLSRISVHLALWQSHQQLQKQLAETQKLNAELIETQFQLLQSEKMASIGQLAAGVAHELNNPIGFVHSNLGTLGGYLHDLMSIIESFESISCTPGQSCKQHAKVHGFMEEHDFAYVKEDIFNLLAESKEGLERVRKIVQDLKSFSHVGEQQWQEAALHQGLDSTLNIVWNELKYKCKVVKDYGDIPPVFCLISQLNQVFMNLLINASHAIENHGTITIRTSRQGDDQVCIEISDTGMGISPDNLKRIFEPFFTTKPVGKGTGLGLSLAYSIIQRHHGSITVDSEPGKGSCFRILLPIHPGTEAQDLENAS